MPILAVTPDQETACRRESGATIAVVAILAVAAVAAYARSFQVPFFFDDSTAITENPTIRSLGGAWLPPANGSGVAGRPLANFSLALNYALGGLNPAGYHAVNLALHVLAALTLFGVVRRTLEQPVLRAHFDTAALPLAGLGALGWAVHPLQTEAVICVVQRNELMAGLFYLLTLYGFIRSTGSVAPLRWQLLAWVSCLLGMASKEIMVTAPLMVLLYDRTFVAGSFAEALRQRRRFYLALAATWLLLAWLVFRSGGTRGQAAGFGLGVSAWEYLLTQCRALIMYLQLAVWPHPLVIDYGTAVAKAVGEVWLQGTIVVALLTATGWALRHRPVFGFAGAWFFVILAPSSSVVPLVTQTMAEHRMYLPLAVLVMLAVIGLHAWLGRRGLWVGALLAVGCGVFTWCRTADYRNEVTIWEDAAARYPTNVRAYHNLAALALAAGRWTEAIDRSRQALRLKPDFADACSNLGLALSHTGQREEALRSYAETLRLNPRHAEAHNNLGQALLETGRWDEAAGHLQAALAAKPEFAEPHNNLGNVLLQQGRPVDAVREFEEALRLKPGFAEPHNNLGNVFQRGGRMAEAAAQYEEALRLKPEFAEPHNNLGNILSQAGRLPEAISHFREALRLQPDYAEAQLNWGNACAQLGDMSQAVAHYEQAVRLKPAYADAHVNWGNALLELDRKREAVAHYKRAVELQPALAAARKNLAFVLVQLGQLPEAVRQYEALLRLTPADAEAQAALVALKPRLKGD